MNILATCTFLPLKCQFNRGIFAINLVASWLCMYTQQYFMCTRVPYYRKTHTLTCTRLKMYVTCGTGYMSFLVHCVSVVLVVHVVFWYLYYCVSCVFVLLSRYKVPVHTCTSLTQFHPPSSFGTYTRHTISNSSRAFPFHDRHRHH
jgi:hypothetical protein